MSSGFVFDSPRYLRLARELADSYRSACPFPHVVIDEFLPRKVADAVLAEFPGPADRKWYKFRAATEHKLALQGEREFPPTIRRLLLEFNSAPCLAFLEALTGITGLITDPYFVGGGLHQIEPGGWLKIHADFNKHARFGLDRRLNLLVYLNRDWKEEYGGDLELWDPAMTRCVRIIAPLFNRCVIFSTTDTAFHGHPEPLRSPAGVTRKSLALYYYSSGRPQDEVSGRHTTVFRERPQDRFATVLALRRLARELTPPIVWTVLRRARGADR